MGGWENIFRPRLPRCGRVELRLNCSLENKLSHRSMCVYVVCVNGVSMCIGCVGIVEVCLRERERDSVCLSAGVGGRL